VEHYIKVGSADFVATFMLCPRAALESGNHSLCRWFLAGEDAGTARLTHTAAANSGAGE